MEEDMATSEKLDFTAPADVECNVCIGRKRKKAKRSCLGCRRSFCRTHLELHNVLHVGKGCKLVASGRLQERICTKHNKLMKAFCRTDQKCVCHLCIMDEHKNHDFASINDGAAEKKVWFFLKMWCIQMSFLPIVFDLFYFSVYVCASG